MDVEILKTRKRLLTHLLTHGSCPDGLASAMIIKHALPAIEVVFVGYNSDTHRNIDAREGDMFCDFTPHRDRVDDWVAVGTVVLDHHKGAQDIVERFGERGVFADERAEPGVCGAVLAYREVLQPLRGHNPLIEQFATRAGIRDTWQKHSPEWPDACAQAEALTFFGPEKMLDYTERVAGPYLLFSEHEVGRLLYEKKLRDAQMAAQGVLRLGDFVLMNNIRLTSDTAEQLRNNGDKAKALVGFQYLTDEKTGELTLVYSMRSIADGYDVSTLAKANGGGGHTKAAGFSVRGHRAHAGSPIALFERALKIAYEAS